MARRADPRIEQVVSLLPADGTPIAHTAWRDSIIQAGDFSLLQMTQSARRSGDVIFEIGDYERPSETLTVRRAFIKAAPAQSGTAAQRAKIADAQKAGE